MSSQASLKAYSWFAETTKAAALVRIKRIREFIKTLQPWVLPQEAKKSNSELSMEAKHQKQGVIARLPRRSVRLNQVKAVTLTVKENARIGGTKAKTQKKIRKLKIHRLKICLNQTL